MPTEFESMEQATPFEQLLLLLVGAEKAGKSRVAATAREPILFHDFDCRRQSIAGIPGVYAISYREKSWPNQPSAYQEQLDVLTKLEGGADLRQLGFANVDSGVKARTNVLDSAATASKAALGYALFTTKELRREINIAGFQVHFPKGWDGWMADMSMIESLVLRFMALPQADFIMTIHEEPEQSPESTSEKKSFTGRIDVFPGRHRRLIKYFNEVWRVSRENGTIPSAQLLPNYKFTAATNLNVSGDVQGPNIKSMIASYMESRAK